MRIAKLIVNDKIHREKRKLIKEWEMKFKCKTIR
jgi:hypothetical protein